MSREIITGLDDAGISVASATYEIVGLPPLRLERAPQTERPSWAHKGRIPFGGLAPSHELGFRRNTYSENHTRIFGLFAILIFMAAVLLPGYLAG